MTQHRDTNVLLVDDDKVFNFLSKKILEGLGFVNDIDTALDGQHALDLLNGYFHRSKPLPDIILLDLSMPIMDGFGFLKAYNSLDLPDKKHIKIIIVSSSQNPNDIEKAKQLGVDSYLSKPLEEHSLRAALKMI